jgi:hypothetical protein
LAAQEFDRQLPEIQNPKPYMGSKRSTRRVQIKSLFTLQYKHKSQEDSKNNQENRACITASKNQKRELKESFTSRFASNSSRSAPVAIPNSSN